MDSDALGAMAGLQRVETPVGSSATYRIQRFGPSCSLRSAKIHHCAALQKCPSTVTMWMVPVQFRSHTWRAGMSIQKSAVAAISRKLLVAADSLSGPD
jgi:hypothetical protein